MQRRSFYAEAFWESTSTQVNELFLGYCTGLLIGFGMVGFLICDYVTFDLVIGVALW